MPKRSASRAGLGRNLRPRRSSCQVVLKIRTDEGRSKLEQIHFFQSDPSRPYSSYQAARQASLQPQLSVTVSVPTSLAETSGSSGPPAPLSTSPSALATVASSQPPSALSAPPSPTLPSFQPSATLSGSLSEILPPSWSRPTDQPATLPPSPPSSPKREPVPDWWRTPPLRPVILSPPQAPVAVPAPPQRSELEREAQRRHVTAHRAAYLTYPIIVLSGWPAANYLHGHMEPLLIEQLPRWALIQVYPRQETSPPTPRLVGMELSREPSPFS
ncbi:hypothetical protein GGR53DRAFT_484688 [Hypoxylon sp. FL1150]|nr:hypothetical protein GGR53DRAFT_484688 [Hypoxylon sp. FL1150]